MMSQSDIVLHLSLINGVGPKLISLLTKKYEMSDLSCLYSYAIVDFKEKYGLTTEKASLVYFGLKNKEKILDEKSIAKKHSHYIITPYDIWYPPYLMHISVIPPVLYIAVTSIDVMKIFHKNVIAVVSSRKTNGYGERAISAIIKGFSGNQVSIISGGAIGGDTIAHNAAMENNIPTVVILGSALDCMYPQQNLFLFKKIVENNGCVISQFSYGYSPNKGSFPARNAIIAGMADVILVGQATKKSGTLITAQLGLEFGKEIGIIPGIFDDLMHEGSHDLLKQGAHCITKSDDILALCSIENDIFKNNNMDVLEKEYRVFENSISQEELMVIEFCKIPRSYNEIVNSLEADLVEKLDDCISKKYIVKDILGRYQNNII